MDVAQAIQATTPVVDANTLSGPQPLHSLQTAHCGVSVPVIPAPFPSPISAASRQTHAAPSAGCAACAPNHPTAHPSTGAVGGEGVIGDGCGVVCTSSGHTSSPPHTMASRSSSWLQRGSSSATSTSGDRSGAGAAHSSVAVDALLRLTAVKVPTTYMADPSCDHDDVGAHGAFAVGMMRGRDGHEGTMGSTSRGLVGPCSVGHGVAPLGPTGSGLPPCRSHSLTAGPRRKSECAQSASAAQHMHPGGAQGGPRVPVPPLSCHPSDRCVGQTLPGPPSTRRMGVLQPLCSPPQLITPDSNRNGCPIRSMPVSAAATDPAGGGGSAATSGHAVAPASVAGLHTGQPFSPRPVTPPAVLFSPTAAADGEAQPQSTQPQTQIDT